MIDADLLPNSISTIRNCDEVGITIEDVDGMLLDPEDNTSYKQVEILLKPADY